MDITICDDGFVAEIKNDSDFNAMTEVLFGEPVESSDDDEWATYWWAIEDEDSDLDGEEFFTELKNATPLQHRQYAHEIFPNVKLHCFGCISQEEAEMMGLDTY